MLGTCKWFLFSLTFIVENYLPYSCLHHRDIVEWTQHIRVSWFWPRGKSVYHLHRHLDIYFHHGNTAAAKDQKERCFVRHFQRENLLWRRLFVISTATAPCLSLKRSHEALQAVTGDATADPGTEIGLLTDHLINHHLLKSTYPASNLCFAAVDQFKSDLFTLQDKHLSWRVRLFKLRNLAEAQRNRTGITFMFHLSFVSVVVFSGGAEDKFLSDQDSVTWTRDRPGTVPFLNTRFLLIQKRRK